MFPNPPARLVAALFPHWTIEHKNHRLLRCPPGRALAMEAAEPRASAAVGLQQRLCGRDRRRKPGDDRLCRQRWPSRATPWSSPGSPSDDAMAGIRAQATRLRCRTLRRAWTSPTSRPMLLTALPPDFLYVNGGRPQCDFQDYGAIVKFWIDTLADQETSMSWWRCIPSVKIDIDAPHRSRQCAHCRASGHPNWCRSVTFMLRASLQRSGGRSPVEAGDQL